MRTCKSTENYHTAVQWGRGRECQVDLFTLVYRLYLGNSPFQMSKNNWSPRIFFHHILNADLQKYKLRK